MSRPRLEIVFAAENLLPPIGGAERVTLEWLEELAGRHAVRAVWVAGEEAAPAPEGVEPLPVARPRDGGGYWLTKRLRAGAVARGVDATLDERPADVVLTGLHAGPAAVAAGRRHGAATVVALHSYEALCKFAFAPASACRPSSHCRACPAAQALGPVERRELFAARDAHERSLADADGLVAPSRFVAGACESWCGRRPVVVPSVSAAPLPLPASPRGHVLLAAARWTGHKGRDLLEPLAEALAPRPFVVTEDGLDAALRRRLAVLPHVQIRAGGPIEALLCGARAVLVPSQWPEPFGRVAFEGMASGVPAIASAVGGLQEVVPAPQLVDPPDSPAAWVAAVEALEEPARWARARDAGIRAARAIAAPPAVERLEAVLLDAARAGCTTS